MRDRFAVIVFWQEDRQAFIAQAPGLEGCRAEGLSREGAFTRLTPLMARWMERAGPTSEDHGLLPVSAHAHDASSTDYN